MLKLDSLSPAMRRVLEDVLGELIPDPVRLAEHRRRVRQRKEREAVAAALLDHARFLLDRAEGAAVDEINVLVDQAERLMRRARQIADEAARS